jgi:hypothetical protein
MSQYIQAAAVPSRTLTAILLNSSLATVATAATVVEYGTDTGLYTVSFAGDALTGSYRLLLTDSATSIGVAQYEALFTATAEETVAASEYVNASGGATESGQAAILAAITPLTTVYTPQLDSESIALISGNAYDGTANGVLTWMASKTVDAEQVNFQIRSGSNVVLLDQDTVGVTTLATGSTVTVSLSSAATALLDSDMDVFYFDLSIEFTTDSVWTIATGLVSVTGV